MITYWQQNGRHELPWRTATDAWSILLAEVLLRKTTSAQAAAVYEALASYSPAELVRMDQDALASLLRPLGIHQVCAKQLQLIAQAGTDSGGTVLKSDEVLRALPGVGRYIFNSVRSCAFGVATLAMDTNLIRVMNRVFGWASHRKRPSEDRKLWQCVEALVTDGMLREFNWGRLDFVAEVCTQRKPKCEQCPINEICTYYAANRQAKALEMAE